ncbi:uncharacterized protein [Linepithema humile]|uniref:uncharacterized protein n=1 Tax=Linepithema humile TaxID=83485 RepID=UPI00062341CC|nr:PREDICTED: uncharacterized protein LOC105674635 [Linepithema humile]
MQASLPSEAVGCIKCTTGLTAEELDHITDNINKTLSHPKGREIFERYLERRNLRSSIQCLELYKVCSEILAKELKQPESQDSDPVLYSLTEDVKMVRDISDDLDVPQMDMVLMEQFHKALTNMTSKRREALLGVLEDTKDRSQDYLRKIHENFKQFILEPCPFPK